MKPTQPTLEQMLKELVNDGRMVRIEKGKTQGYWASLYGRGACCEDAAAGSDIEEAVGFLYSVNVSPYPKVTEEIL